MIDPRVNALNDLKKGIKGNKSCYNYIDPFTAED